VMLDNWGGAWVIKDNVFDRCAVLDWCLVAPTHGYNAYVNTAGRISASPQTGDVTLSSLSYYERDLGRFYQHSNSSLKDAGSRSVGNAGLTHYTSSQDYAKDTGNVAIGLHYVATGSAAPIDTDGDGLPDYIEDADGDGIKDGNETDVGDIDTDGDGLSDGAEVLASVTDPLNPDENQDGDDDGVQVEAQWEASPHDYSSVTARTDVDAEQVKRVHLVVPRWIDAVMVRVDISTSIPPNAQDTVNDMFAYRIEGPAGQLPIMGSHHLSGADYWNGSLTIRLPRMLLHI
ncbi:MAG: hypothetical protein RI897_4055, partial [Verrucomicrobiota bacterium]